MFLQPSNLFVWSHNLHAFLMPDGTLDLLCFIYNVSCHWDLENGLSTHFM